MWDQTQLVSSVYSKIKSLFSRNKNIPHYGVLFQLQKNKKRRSHKPPLRTTAETLLDLEGYNRVAHDILFVDRNAYSWNFLSTKICESCRCDRQKNNILIVGCSDMQMNMIIYDKRFKYGTRELNNYLLVFILHSSTRVYTEQLLDKVCKLVENKNLYIWKPLITW